MVRPPSPPPPAPPLVAIEDGKTIDFSSSQPVVKDSPEEKALIAAAVAEMDAAAKHIKFAPSASPPPPAPEKDKAVTPPPAAPPKH